MSNLPGHASEFPFGADVWTRSEYDEEVLLFGHFDEGDQIEEHGHVVLAATEVEFVLARLVKIPCHVSTASAEWYRSNIKDWFIKLTN